MPCTYAWLRQPEYAVCLRFRPCLATNVHLLMSKRLRLANERIQLVVNLHVASRVAGQLLALAAEYGQPVQSIRHAGTA